MKLIVGLGNPGRKYEQTRHNVGFMVASKLAALVAASPSKLRFEGEFAEGGSGQKLAILWPQTFMNASGQSVRKACDFYKLSAEDVLVICDDLNLESGRIRLRASGSAGGQKGLVDIIRHLGTEAFPRLRVGIGQAPQGWEVTDYVLGKFAGEEKDKIEAAMTKAAYAAIDWADQGIAFAMNRHNASPQPKQKKRIKPTSENADSEHPPHQTNDTKPTDLKAGSGDTPDPSR